VNVDLDALGMDPDDRLARIWALLERLGGHEGLSAFLNDVGDLRALCAAALEAEKVQRAADELLGGAGEP
jgi:hypothetical protein